MKKEVPYMPPDVELSTLTTQRADYQWNGDDLPRKPYRPQFVAAVAAPFDSESHSKSTYIPYDQSHYKVHCIFTNCEKKYYLEQTSDTTNQQRLSEFFQRFYWRLKVAVNKRLSKVENSSQYTRSFKMNCRNFQL